MELEELADIAYQLSDLANRALDSDGTDPLFESVEPYNPAAPGSEAFAMATMQPIAAFRATTREGKHVLIRVEDEDY